MEISGTHFWKVKKNVQNVLNRYIFLIIFLDFHKINAIKIIIVKHFSKGAMLISVFSFCKKYHVSLLYNDAAGYFEMALCSPFLLLFREK